jgi:hypothetical protein
VSTGSIANCEACAAKPNTDGLSERTPYVVAATTPAGKPNSRWPMKKITTIDAALISSRPM